MTVQVCPYCETENEAGAKLCIACGQPLGTAEGARQALPGTGPVEREEVERWVRQLPESGTLDENSLALDDESLPVWLKTLRAHADKLTTEEADDLMDFLADLEPGDAQSGEEPPSDEAADQAKMSAELPAWVAALLPDESWPETEADSTLAQHFAEAKEADETRLPPTAPLSQTSPLGDSPELDGIPQVLAGESLPKWLADQKAEEESAKFDEPVPWPGREERTQKLRRPPARPEVAAPEVAAPEVAASQAATPEPESETIETVLDEVAAVSEDVLGQPARAPEDLSELSNWMDPTQSAALEETLEEMLDLPDAETSAGRVDQWLDILEGLPGGPDADKRLQARAEAELDAAGIPDWMESMGPPQTADEPGVDPLGQPEESGPLAGLRGVIPGSTFPLAGGVDRRAGNLALTKEQRMQAALLRRLTSAETETAATHRLDADSFLPARLVLGGALVLVILVGLLVPGLADFLPLQEDAALPPAAVQAHEAVVESSGRSALVAFDYTPSMSGELDGLARTLLADLAANDVSVLTVSQVAAGVPMAERATASGEAQVAASLGYLPGEASGLRALGACLNRGCDALAGRQLRIETRAALNDVSLIVVLAGDRDSLVNWLEQVGSRSDVRIIGGVTQSLGPVARPYVESRQLSGLLEGLPIGVAYGEAQKLAPPVAAEQLAAVTLAQWLVIGALLVGLVYFGFSTSAASAVGRVTKK